MENNMKRMINEVAEEGGERRRYPSMNKDLNAIKEELKGMDIGFKERDVCRENKHYSSLPSCCMSNHFLLRFIVPEFPG